MNRQAKRMMQRQKATPQDRAESVKQRRQLAPTARKRTPPMQFLREVRTELRKVAWPSRQELVGYTAVVMVAIVVLTSYVFGLDTFFAKVVLRVFGQGA